MELTNEQYSTLVSVYKTLLLIPTTGESTIAMGKSLEALSIVLNELYEKKEEKNNE